METNGFFVQPRPKKGLLVPPPKKRKIVHKVEEVSFDKDARAEYLSGFRKRKQARIKHAREVAEEEARKERIELRKQIREDRKRELEEHVQHVHKLIREANSAGMENQTQDDSDEEWGGISDQEEAEPIDHEEEYIDEGRHTVVTVEAVSVDKEGLYKPVESESEEEDEENEDTAQQDGSKEDSSKNSKEWPAKKKKKKFRYETKLERRMSGNKSKRTR
ncbi:Nucleolar protein 12 (25kDa) domain containing protein [Rhypophila decipiens]